MTFYDDATGERVELSVATFDNWVAKTANLLRDGLDVQPGGRVGLLLPLHWQAAVWIVACWAAGAVVVPGSMDADVIVADATSLATVRNARGADVVGLSLAPLGAPLREAPQGVLDYAIEVRGYGDRFEMRPRPAPADPALEVGGRILSQGAMTDVAGLRSGDRLLTASRRYHRGRSSRHRRAPRGRRLRVLCRNLDAAWLVRRMAAEHVCHRRRGAGAACGGTPGHLNDRGRKGVAHIPVIDAPPLRRWRISARAATSPRHARPVQRRRGRRVVRWLALAVVAGLLVTAGGAFGVYRKLEGNIASLDIFGTLGSPRGRGGRRSEPALNILLIGSDTRETTEDLVAAGGEDVPGARSDTTILLHLSADRSRAVAVSIPRDSWVPVPSCTTADGGASAPVTTKFNAAFETGGPACTIQTVESLNVRIDHFVVIDFAGFTNMVGALGGVDVCVPEETTDSASGLDLPAGRSTIDGDQALAFVRARKGIGDGSDLGRIDRQQAFLASWCKRQRAQVSC